MTLSRRNRSVGAAGALAAAALISLAGCTSGHGKHTTEGVNLAQERMASIKAGTEWDRARQQYLSGDLNKALKTIDTSLSISDSIPKSHHLKGRILVELGRLEPAVDSFKRAIAIDPEFTEAHYYLGIVYERFRTYDDALAKYQHAADLDPSNAQYLLAASEMLIELGRNAEARDLLRSRASTFEHNAGVRQTLGHIALMEGDLSEAIELFNAARLLAPDDLSILEDLALAQISAGKFADAEYSLRRLTSDQEFENRRDLLQARARCLLVLDRPVEARRILLELVAEEAGHHDVKTWIALGEAAVILDDLPRLRLVGQRLVRIAAERPEGELFLAIEARRKGDLDQALRHVDKALAVAEEDPAPLLFRAVLLAQMGRTDEAAQVASRAAAIDPGNQQAQRLLTAFVEER